MDREAGGKYLKILGGLRGTEIICNTLHFPHFVSEGVVTFIVKNLLKTSSIDLFIIF